MAGGAKGFVFQRVEKKYLLNSSQYEKFLDIISPHMAVDQYGLTTICNIYFDTKEDDLVRASIEKPPYKEKLRLRSYGIPTLSSTVYLEIKKKYSSVVYKRRISFTLKEAEDYLLEGIRPKQDSQILREIDYFLQFHQPIPRLYLAYDRVAYYGKEDADFRMTFDTKIRSRRDDLFLEHGDSGVLLYDKDYYLLEIKAASTYPLWLAKALSELEIFPVSFSKYGTVYKKEVVEKSAIKTMMYEDKIISGKEDIQTCLTV